MVVQLRSNKHCHILNIEALQQQQQNEKIVPASMIWVLWSLVCRAGLRPALQPAKLKYLYHVLLSWYVFVNNTVLNWRISLLILFFLYLHMLATKTEQVHRPLARWLNLKSTQNWVRESRVCFMSSFNFVLFCYIIYITYLYELKHVRILNPALIKLTKVSSSINVSKDLSNKESA